jgi:PilZ domain
MSTQPMVSIADAISAIPSPYPPISLIKHYKGTTLNQVGRIVDINPVSATIQASQRVTFHVLLGLIHLRSRAFPGAISATIRPIDYGDGTFYLSDLTYGNWRDRKTERVQPKCPIYIDISYYRKSYRACMEDISNEGMGILVNKDIDPANRLKPGVKLSLEFRITPEHLISNLRGIIVYRKNEGQYLVKFGLQILPKADQKKYIQSYIFQRSDEIRKELEQDYIRICDPCRVENQYF